MNLVNGVMLITNILGTFSIFKLMTVFFDRRSTNKYVEIFSYILYYAINCIIFIVCPVPIVILMLSIISIFAITFNYENTIKRRIIATIYICLIILAIEIGFMALFEYKKIFIFKVQEIHSIYSIICVKAIVYTVALILSERKFNIKKVKDLSALYWVGVVSIPLASLIVMILFLNITTGNKQIEILVVLMVLTIINIVSFQLYNYIISVFQEENRRLVLQKQSEAYLQQLKMFQDDNRKMSLIRHDIKNHLLMLKLLYERGEFESCKQYFNDLLSKMKKTEGICNSGNLVIDSIINYKLRELDASCIYVDAYVPGEVNIPDIDMTTILGNLLDNSIQALKETRGKQILRISINYSRGRMILQIENSYEKILEENGELKTTKTEKEGHGIGLESIKEVVERYDGILQLDYKENLFVAFVVLFC